MSDDNERAGSDSHVEKWILRSLVFSMLGAAVVAVGASVDDIKRYLRMRQM